MMKQGLLSPSNKYESNLLSDEFVNFAASSSPLDGSRLSIVPKTNSLWEHPAPINADKEVFVLAPLH